MKNGLDPNSGLIRGSTLEEILQNGENWKGLSEMGKTEWFADLEILISQALAY
jgi:hypothetical protein